jgi:hypothetical protein
MAQHLSGPSSLTGQVALIIGGAGGMGRAIANVSSTLCAPRAPLASPAKAPTPACTRSTWQPLR